MTDPDQMAELHRCGNDAAAYVLGALEPDEAHAFVGHLKSCAACRDQVATFQQAVDALPMSASQYEAPGAIRRRVMRSVRAEPKASIAQPRRKRPWELHPVATLRRPALAGGLALVLALAVVGGAELGAGGSGPRVIQASVGRAQLRLTGGRGELIVDRLPPPPRGRIYELWLQHGARAPSPSTLFGVTSQGTADVGLPGDLNGVSRVLVTAEPSGGSQAPTARPVIVAQLT